MWTRPFGTDVIDAARQGDFPVVLISTRLAPREWFPHEMQGVDILCLASGGGQQGPMLAAAGPNVTVFDNFDSRPPVDAPRNDFGVTSSLGWKF